MCREHRHTRRTRGVETNRSTDDPVVAADVDRVVGADANPWRAASAVPLRSPVMSFNPRTLLMFDGFPQFQASCTANTTIDDRHRVLAKLRLRQPMPHALTGCDRSVQFTVLLVQLVVLKPAMPIPERTFQLSPP